MRSRPSKAPVSHWPGAVPLGLDKIIAPLMTSACLALFAAIFHLRAAKRSSRAARISPSRSSSSPSALATASRVKSSSGSETAAEDDDVGAKKCVLRRSNQLRQIVAHHAFEDHLHPQQIKLLGEVERVGIDAVGSEKLGPHGDDLGIHDLKV